jgi:hypothetical protein
MQHPGFGVMQGEVGEGAAHVEADSHDAFAIPVEAMTLWGLMRDGQRRCEPFERAGMVDRGVRLTAAAR